jgi:hypothetical protein
MTRESRNTSDRLILVEQKQKEMASLQKVAADMTAKQFVELKKALKDNTDITNTIMRTLDELTGAKKFLMWFTSFIVGIGAIVAIVWSAIHGAHK